MTEKSDSLTPIITIKELQEAYKSLSQANLLKYNPLRGFIFVRQQAIAEHSTEDINSLVYVVEQILIDLVTEKLQALRQLYSLSAPSLDLSLDKIQVEMKADAQTNNMRLIGFSYMYFRYIRSDLEWNLSIFSQYYAQTERNLRRHEQKSLAHLRQSIIQREQKARQNYWRTLTRQNLPKSHSIRLEGQSEHVQRLVRQFLSGNLNHLHIWGEAGSGKSTLALHIAHALIDEFFVHKIVYLDLRQIQTKPSVEILHQLIEEQLQIPEEHSLQDYLAILMQHERHILIVLDNVHVWQVELNHIGEWLGYCRVITSSDTSQVNWHGQSIKCPPLNRPDSLRLLAFYDPHYPKKLAESVYFKIFEDIGGHPQKLKLAIRYYGKAMPISEIPQMVQREHYLQQWYRLGQTAQQIWVLVSIMQLELDKIYQDLLFDTIHEHLAMDRAVIHSALHELLQSGLVTWQEHIDQYSCFIESEVLDSIQESLAYRTQINDLAKRDLGNYQLALVEILARQNFDYETLRPQLFKVKNDILSRGEWQRWQNLLTHLRRQQLPARAELEIEIEKAVAWRWAGQFERALTHLEMIISNSRRQGIYEIYIEALIEESNVHSWLGHIEVAYQAAVEAYDLLEHIENPEITNRCLTALGQSLIETKPKQARQLLEQIETPNAQAWDVWARIEMVLNNPKNALEAAEKSVNAVADMPHHPAYARAIGLYARLLDFDQQYHQAIREFNYAIHLLQINQDWLGLARLYTNYSIACVHYVAGMSHAENRHEYLMLAEKAVKTALKLHENLQDPPSYKIAKQALVYVQEAQQYYSRR